MLEMNRRSFLKAAAAIGVATPVLQFGGLSFAQNSPTDSIRKVRTICRGCGKFECSVWVTIKNDRPIKITGDKLSHGSKGNCCSKALASIQTCFHPDRLLYPMKRTKPKGQEAGWVRISWNEALETAAKKFLDIKNKYGANSIRLHHGASRITSYACQMVMQGLGSANIGMTAGQVCKGPRAWAAAMTFFRGGNYVSLNDGVECYVQWGGNTEISNNYTAGAATVDGKFKAKKHIVIGPRQQNLGAQADYWLALRPGTDGAMAMAWIKQIIDNKKYDAEFITKWSNAAFLYSDAIAPSGFTWSYRQGMMSDSGIEPLDIKTRIVKESDMVKGGSSQKYAFYDTVSKKILFFDGAKAEWPGDYSKLKPAIEGVQTVTLADGKKVKAVTVFDKLKASVAKYTPEYTGKICSLDPKLIKEACNLYSSFKYGGGIFVGNGLEHAGNCIQSIRSVWLISSLTGNIDTKGGHRGGDDNVDDHLKILPYQAATAIPDPESAKRRECPGASAWPLMAWGLTMYSAPAIGDMAIISDMTITGKPYPIKALFGMTGSFTQNANASNNYKAYKALEFNFTAEIFMTPTAELADIVVPSAHWLENEVIRASQGAEGVLGAMTGPVKFQGEAWPDPEICVQLLKKMNIPFLDPKLETNPKASVWPNMKELNDRSVSLLHDRLGIKNWNDFKEKFQKQGVFDYKQVSPVEWGEYRRYEKTTLRNDGLTGFPTPTTRLELLSTILESYHPGNELPVYKEPPLSEFTEDGKKLRSRGYDITLLTGVRSPVYFHSETRMTPYCRENHLLPRVQINPELAAKIGVKQGDWVWIENHKGKIRQTVDIFHGIAPDVASADHAWYYPELPGPEHGWHYSNVNVLVDDKYRDPIIGANLLKTYPVKIYKAIEGAPEGIITSVSDPRLKRWMPKFPAK
ncbi:MAG: molybdopterin-dependent oxidoreductase [Deferribacteraceae bacterium]|jgi:anaerobic selenocysteine-containing dehydrogenase|nr:molybdopterin-dependent oxidoreductase [Deferribacteraceae bacterium]